VNTTSPPDYLAYGCIVGGIILGVVTGHVGIISVIGVAIFCYGIFRLM
jgi:hypothetical protein